MRWSSATPSWRAETIAQATPKSTAWTSKSTTLCIRLLALHQPAASDLRFITTGLKITTDLERIGDMAVNICERVAGAEP